MQEEELKKFQPIDELQFSTQGGHGVLERQPEDSVYYHATLNPTGASSAQSLAKPVLDEHLDHAMYREHKGNFEEPFLLGHDLFNCTSKGTQ